MTVGPSRQAVIGFVVNDLTPWAVVTIRITGRHGTMRCDAGIQPTNRPDAVMLTSELPYGTYRYEVLATDLAGNRSRVDGSNLLLVPAPSLVVRAWVDATAPTTGSRVIAFCLVTDQFGWPISGATVSFAWHRGTVTRHGAPMVTGRGGGAYSTCRCAAHPRQTHEDRRHRHLARPDAHRHRAVHTAMTRSSVRRRDAQSQPRPHRGRLSIS